MQPVTDKIRNAFRRLRLMSNEISQAELARRMGLSPQHLNKIYKNMPTHFNDSTWATIEPVLRPYLEDDSAPVNADNEAVPVREANVQFRAVPVLSFAQAAGYEPALEPLCDYLRETSDRSALFFDVADNCFALEVSGDSMAPDYPNGSIALVAAGDYPQRGDIVAAKLNDGQVVIKEYHRCNNVITLTSINPDGKSFEWHCKEQPGYVQWMWPVLEIILKPRDRRWAQRKMRITE